MPYQNWWDSVVTSWVGPGANPNDPDITREPTMIQLYGQLMSVQQKLHEDMMDFQTTQYVQSLKQKTESRKQLNDYMTTLMQERAAGSRVSATNFANINRTVAQESSDLEQKLHTYDDAKLRALESTAQTMVGSKVENYEQGLAVQALTGAMAKDPFGSGVRNELSTRVHALRKAGVDITAPGWQEDLQDLVGDTAFIEQAMTSANTLASDYMGIRRQQEVLQRQAQSGNAYYEGIKAGASPDSDHMKKLRDNALADLNAANEVIKDVNAGHETTIQQIEEFYEKGANQMAFYDEVFKALSQNIIGPAAVGPEKGKLVESEGFRSWAKMNGYPEETLGYISKDGVYVAGGNDDEAILRFRYQQNNPDKLAPGVHKNQRLGKVAVIEREYSPEDLKHFATTADGSYYVRDTEDGPMPVRKDDLLLKQKDVGGYVVEKDGRTFVVSPPSIYADYSKVGSKLQAEMTKLDREYKAGDLTKDAYLKGLEGIRDAAAKVEAGLTDDERAAVNTFEAASKPDADVEQRASIAASLHMFDVIEVDADGKVRDVPVSEYRDTVFAKATKEGNVLDVDFIKPENYKIGEAFTKAVATQYRIEKKVPSRLEYIDAYIPHFTDYNDGDFFLRGVDVSGNEVRFNMDGGEFKLVDTKDVGSNARLIKNFNAEELYEQAVAEERGIEYKRTKSVEKGASGKKEARKDKRAEKAEERVAVNVGRQLVKAGPEAHGIEPNSDLGKLLATYSEDATQKFGATPDETTDVRGDELTPMAALTSGGMREKRRDLLGEIGRRYVDPYDMGISKESLRNLPGSLVSPAVSRSRNFLKDGLQKTLDFYDRTPGALPRKRVLDPVKIKYEFDGDDPGAVKNPLPGADPPVRTKAIPPKVVKTTDEKRLFTTDEGKMQPKPGIQYSDKLSKNKDPKLYAPRNPSDFSFDYE